MLRQVLTGLLVTVVLPWAAQAAEEGEYLTWVRHYQIQPGMGKDFVEMIKEVDGPLLDKLIEEQKILSWGMLTPFTMADETWTHAIWISYRDWTHLDGFMHAMIAAETERSASENDALKSRFMRMVKPDSVHDEVYRNVIVPSSRGAEAADATPAYLRVSSYKVYAGRQKDVMNMYKEYAVPVYEELRSSGAVLDYALASCEVVSNTDTTHISWAITADLAGLDRIHAAFDRASQARSSEEEKKLMEGMEDKFDMDQYRSQILRILHVSM